ncbi:MAG: hypothetical protein FE834_07115 [Gammaproteobacteria bacterium]|nr:hypothetical protein [Gammaproteobacteria bacterium]
MHSSHNQTKKHLSHQYSPAFNPEQIRLVNQPKATTPVLINNKRFKISTHFATNANPYIPPSAINNNSDLTTRSANPPPFAPNPVGNTS